LFDDETLTRETMTQSRTFRDRTGVEWRVSEIAADIPGADEDRERRNMPRSVSRSFTKGMRFATRPHAWLHFESKSEARRVSSVPNHWENLDDGELEDLMAYSQPL
jgi:hypothetical protein